MKRSSLFRTIAIIVTTTGLTLSVAGGAIAVHALNNGFKWQNANNQNGNGEKVRSVASIEKTNSYGLADEYTIYYTDNTTSVFVVYNGADGAQGIQGYPGVDGHTPTIEIGATGTWIIDGADTGVTATGPRGQDGRSIISIDKTNSDGLIDTYTITYSDDTTSTFIVVNGEQGPQGIQGMPGSSGHTPVINIDATTGNWVVDGVDTGIAAQGPAGQNGLTPHIGQNGNWWIGETDTGVSAQGSQGQQGNPGQNGASVYTGNGEPASGRGHVGDTYIDLNTGEIYNKTENGWEKQSGNSGFAIPHIGTNGNWWVGDTDTGIAATGPQGQAGRSIVSVEKTYSDGNVDTYTITYSDNTYSYFYVTNGTDGVAGAQGVPGTNGHTPEITIGSNGNWFVDGTDTGIHAQGPQGVPGQNGVTPHIGENGNWWIGETDTGVKAQGQQGEQGQTGQTPYIGSNGNWWIGDQDLGVAATGPQGQQGNPGQNGNSVLTGDAAPDNSLGSDGDSYINLNNYDIYTKEAGEWVLKGNLKGQNGQDGRSIVSIDKTGNNGLIDEYTITYSDGTTSLFYVVNGQDGATGGQGIQGVPGADGHTPVIEIGSNGNWVIDGTDTGIAAQGPQGVPGQDGTSMRTGIGAPTDALGQNGDSYIDLDTWNFYVKDNGTWTLKGNIKGAAGSQGGQGEQGPAGQNGTTPHIGTNGNWWIGETDTGVKAQGPQGEQGQQGQAGQSPYIGSNGNWWVGDQDLGVKAQGPQGQQGQAGSSVLTGAGAPEADNGEVGDSYIDTLTWDFYVKTNTGWGTPVGNIKGGQGNPGTSITVTSVEKTNTEGLVDTYTITFSDGSTTTFTVTNGATGAQGQAGNNGKTLLTGIGAPAVDQGVEGDSYVDVQNWIYYVKTSEGWQNKGSFKGSDGTNGNDGVSITDISYTSSAGLVDTYTITFSNGLTTTFTVTNGANGTNGNTLITGSVDPTTEGVNGDSYLNTTTWEYFVKEADTWVSKGTIKGDDGATGPAGADGTSVKTGSGAPADDFGAVGDSYIDIDTWNFYVKTDTGWGTPVGNIHNSPNTYTVTYNSNGGSSVDANDSATEGQTITAPTDPTKDGYYFQGWYTTEGNKWNFEKDVVTGNITLIAHWAQFKVENGVLTGCSIDSGDIVIPEFFDDQLVTKIGEEVFKGKTGITSVTIPHTITEIGESAFEGCTGLTSFFIPNNVKTIGDKAFKDCANLAYVYMQESQTTRSSTGGIETIGAYAFQNCGLKALVIPQSVKSIGQGAFQGEKGWTVFNNIKEMYSPTASSIAIGPDDTYMQANPNVGDIFIETNNSLVWVYNIDGSWHSADQLQLYNTINSGNGAPTTDAESADFNEVYLDLETGNMYVNSTSKLESISLPFVGGNADGSNGYLGYIFGASDASENNSYVPHSLANVIVTGNYAIAENAMSNCQFVETIDITGDPSSIGFGAFKDCNSLKSISIPFIGSTPTLPELKYGTGAPSASLSGSMYVDTATQDIYINNGSGWTLFNNLTDITGGEPFAFGHGVPTGAGTFYFDLDTGGLYLCQPSGWMYGGNIGDMLPSSATYFTVIFGDDKSSPFNLPYSLTKVIVTKGNGENRDIIPSNAFADQYSIKEYIISNGIREIGANAFKSCYELKSIALPNSITKIGDHAFEDCYGLESIILPTSLKTIGIGAFMNCNDLQTLYIPEGVTEIGHQAFKECSDLRYVYLPNTLLTIGNEAFASCDDLESIVIPDSVTFINKYAFVYCSSLKSITVPFIGSDPIGGNDVGDQTMGWLFAGNFPSTLKTITVTRGNGVNRDQIPEEAFANCNDVTTINLPNNIKTIGDYAFQYAGIEFLILPGSVNSVGNQAFEHCNNLTSIIFQEGANKTFGTKVFYQSTHLKSVVINGQLSSIGTQSFTGCSALEYVSLGVGLTSISDSMFLGLTNLKTVIIPQTVTSIGTSAFAQCSSLKAINLPNVTSIGTTAFYGCTSLEEMILPNTVTSIGDRAFYYCSSLKYLELNEGLTSIGIGTFTHNAITNLIIPSTVTSIGSDAFALCSNLVSVYMEEGPAITIGGNAFGSCSALKTFIIKSDIASFGNQILAGSNALEYAALGEGLTELSQCLFDGFTELKGVVLPSSITSIAAQAFHNCSSLEAVVLPNGVTKIGSRAFSGCTSLSSVTFGNSLKTILEYAFENCSSLTEVTLPASTRDLARGVFSGCNNLASLTMPTIGGIYDTIATPILTGTLANNELPATGLGSDNSIYIDTAHAKIYRKIDGVWYYQLSIINPNTGDPATIHTGTTNSGPYSGVSNGDYYVNLTNGNWYFRQSNSWKYYYGGIKALFAHIGYIFLESTGSSPIGQFYTSVPTSLKSLIINGTPDEIIQSSLNGVELETLSIPYIGGEPNQSYDKLGFLFVPADGYYNNHNSYVPSSLKNLYVTGDYDIPGSAFEYCSNLENVALTGNYSNYGSFVFLDCNNLKSLTVHHITSSFSNNFRYYSSPESLKTIVILSGTGSNNDELTGSIGCCKYVETVIVPTNIKTIGYGFFNGCESLKNFVIPEGVTTIGDGAFNNCKSLTSIVVPDSVTSFDEYVFSGCINLTYVKLSKAIIDIPRNTFFNCKKLNNVVFGDIVTIGESAFGGCESLISIVMPDTITSIGKYAFQNCYSLMIVKLPESGKNNITSIGERAFCDCYALTYCNLDYCTNLTTIEESTFARCRSLHSIKIPNSVTSIARFAFTECRSLTYVDLGNGVRTIDYDAFEYCYSLSSINLEYVETIGTSAFARCYSLTYVKFGSSLKTIGYSAFNECPLKAITLPNSITELGSYAFSNNSYLESLSIPFIGTTREDTSHNLIYILGDQTMNALKTLVVTNAISIGSSALYNSNNLVSVTINDSCSSIGASAFYGCKALQYVKLPSSLQRLDGSTFSYCEKLTSITLPNSLTYIGESCFIFCTSLTNVVIPNNVTYIGSYAFENCSSLKTVRFGDSVEEIDYQAFAYCPLLQIVVFNDGLKTIGDYAFVAASIESIVIPGSVEEIGNSSFTNCKQLAYVAIEDGVQRIGDNVFANCSSLKNVVIPDSVIAISYGVFYNCDSLESLTIPFVGDGSEPGLLGHIFNENNDRIPTSLKTVVVTGDKPIGYHAFMDCSHIETIAITGHPSAIGAGAFTGCSGLTNLTIPFVGGASSIGDIITGSDDPNEIHWSVSPVGNLKSDPSTTTIIYDFYYGDTDNLPDGTIIVHLPDYSHPNGYAQIIVKTQTGSHYGFEQYTGETGYAVPVLNRSTYTWWFNGVDTGIAGPHDSLYNLNYTTGTGAPTDNPNPWTVYIDQETGNFYIVEYDGDSNNWHYESTPNGNIKTDPSTTAIFAQSDPDFVDAMNNGHFDEYIQSLPENTILVAIAYNGITAIRVGTIYEYSVEYQDYTGATGIALPHVGSNGNYWLGDTDTGYVALDSISSIYNGNGAPSSSCYSYTIYVDEDTFDVYVPTRNGNVNDLYFNTDTGEISRFYGGAWYTEDSINSNTILGTTAPDNALGDDGNFYLNTDTGDYYQKQSGVWGLRSNIKEHYTSLGYYFLVFSNSSIYNDFTNITITEDVDITSGAFKDVFNLETITFLGEVHNIGDYAFANCYELQSFEMPYDLETIGAHAFENCYSLKYIDFNNTYHLRSIGDYAFNGCGAVENIVIPNTIISIGKGAFMNRVSWNHFVTMDNLLNGTTDPVPALGNDGDFYINTVTSESFEKIGDDWVSAGVVPFTYGHGAPNDSTVGYEYLDVDTGRFYESIGTPSSLKTITLPFIGGDAGGSNSYLGYIFGADTYSESNTYVPETLKVVVLTSSTVVRDHAFANCSNVETIMLPSSITAIGEEAFYECYGIKAINIPNGCTSIGDNAFYKCINLSYVSIFDANLIMATNDYSHIQNIGKYAFAYTSLRDVVLTPELATIGTGAFSSNIHLTEASFFLCQITSLGNDLFRDCYNLRTVRIEDGTLLPGIKKGMFDGCSSLAYITLPDVTSIGDYAFAGCQSLTTIVIPSSVTSIGNYVFEGCDNLGVLSMPYITGCGLTNLFGNDASNVPASLKTLILTGNNDISLGLLEEVTSVETLIIRTNGDILEHAFEDCDSLKEVRIEGNIVNIEQAAFYDCESLETITFPNSLSTIGDNAFMQDRMLTKVVFSHVVSIGIEAFAGCWSLYYVHLGANLTTVGQYAFKDCSSLSTLIIPTSLTAANVSPDAFNGCCNMFIRYLGLESEWTASGLEAIFPASNRRGISYRN